MSRTEDEMQITLARLRDEFGMDVAQAQNLHGQELADWLELAEDDLFSSLCKKDGSRSSRRSPA